MGKKLRSNQLVYSSSSSHAEGSPELDSRKLLSAASSGSPLLNVETAERSDEERLMGSVDTQGRRDSGVGSSLSRSPSAPCSIRLKQSILASSLPLSSSFSSSLNSSSSSSWSRKKPIGWPSNILKESSDLFLSDAALAHSVDALSVVAVSKLNKLVFMKLTAMLEKHMSPMGGRGMVYIGEPTNQTSAKNWTVHKLLKKIKNLEKDSKEEFSIFAQPLSVIRKRSGLCLPRTILELLRYLRVQAPDTIGIFRKNGVKSRINELREIAKVESEVDVFVDGVTLTPGQVHDAADLLKQYLRELPEPLMTNALSKTFANIYEHIPDPETRLTAAKYAVMQLPEDNREALQTLLFFFADVAKHAEANQMHADNLAVCLAPSLFQLSASRLNAVTSSRRHKTIGATGMPTEAEMRETRAAQLCLSAMITHAKEMFVMAPEVSLQIEINDYEEDTPVLNSLHHSGPRYFLQNRLNLMLKDHADRWRGWIVEGTVDGVELSAKKSADGHPLPFFRVWTDIDAPPKEVLLRLTKERFVWDTSLVNARSMDSSNAEYELHQYVFNDTVGHPTRDCLVVRAQFTDLPEVRGGCALLERSVHCSETQLLGGVTAAILDSRYLIEPHQGRSRCTHVSRVDLRGRTAAWYSQHYLHIVARQLSRLRTSFRQSIEDGPETKV